MKTRNLYLSAAAFLAIGTLSGCSGSSMRANDVAASIRTSLSQAGLKDVSTQQDAGKGVITLGGHVAEDGDKSQAESIARSFAGAEVVSNQIAVIPHGAGSDAGGAKRMSSDLDSGIGSNLDAALIQDKLRRSVNYQIRNQVVTLTGNVDSESTRTQVETVAASVPNVQQVVNELQVKNQKASSSN